MKGSEMTPAMKTVAVTAADGLGRERAAAFHPAWKMALSNAARKGIRAKETRLFRQKNELEGI